MNTLQKLDKSSRLLVFASVLGVILSATGFFVLANRGAASLSGQEVIARISYYDNDTRVKRSSDIHWNQVSEKIDFYDQDRVFTGPQSQATIHFQDGGEIKLFPNSLVYITKDMVELESGTIEVDNSKGASLNLKSFGEKFAVAKNTKIRIIKEKAAKKIIPLNEEAKAMPIISTLNKEEAEIKSPSFLPAPQVWDKDQKVESDSITLNWDGPADAEYNLEIAEGDMKNIVDSVKVTGLEYKYIITKPAKYYWRVKYYQDDMESLYSNYASFDAVDKVLKIKESLMKSPKKNTRITSGPSVTFNWDEPTPDLEYLLEIFSSEQGKSIASYNVKGNTKTHTFEEESADYWWIVRAISRYGNKSPEVPKYKVSIERPPKIEPMPIPAPAPRPTPKPTPAVIKGEDFILLKGREDLRGAEW